VTITATPYDGVERGVSSGEMKMPNHRLVKRCRHNIDAAGVNREEPCLDERLERIMKDGRKRRMKWMKLEKHSAAMLENLAQTVGRCETGDIACSKDKSHAS
jgi:hypothetical protein